MIKSNQLTVTCSIGAWLHRYLAPFTLLLIITTQLTATPWISPGDIWLRSDIEYLSDRGVIKSPITTWPIMWSGIKKDFDRAFKPDNLSNLSQRELNALLRLKKAFRRATGNSSSVELRMASDTEVLRGFHDTPREEASVEFSQSDMGDSWAYQLNVAYLYNPYVAAGQKEDEVRFDNSFIAVVYDNFSIAYGYVDKWWGPGWDSSSILSTNARPTPGFMIQRNYPDPFETKWLSWIGPWTFNIFANVLDDERHITDAKLFGMSVTFKPLDSLEIGLRRTAQWGGEGRPESLESIIDMILGRDNCGSEGIDNCGADNSNEPGNQLGTIDVKWRLPLEMPMSIYFQITGEDEAGNLPSRKTHLAGFTSELIAWDVPIKYYVEYSDTSLNFGEFYNSAYNHSIYRSGYRYYGDVIGSTYDNDTESFVLGTILSLAKDKKLFVQLSNIDMNVDAIDGVGAGNHSITS
ncbi:MAG: capsule assembly Wzi family protein, partial [Gammaproteobacteria bacterium]|nr:capsule assembly Wzi family protein [Gammaproteobacteria bacterium]